MHVTNDVASYRSRGTLLQKAISHYKCIRYVSKFGASNLIKRSAQFLLTDGAIIEMGDCCTIQDYVLIQLTKPYPRLYIGNRTVVGRGSIITAKSSMRIGDDVLIGSFVQIIDHNHGTAPDRPIREQPAIIGDVIIGNDVWIGAGARILPNVTIGRGAVIGSNAVVTRSVPDYAVAAGVPARVIKYRDK